MKLIQPALALALAACVSALALGAGCIGREVTMLGQPPDETVMDLATARQAKAKTQVTIAGRMVEKCPEAGCWFVLRNGSDRVRVDTKTAGFVVVEVPLNRTVTVSGSWATNGTEVVLAATGIRY